MTSRRKLIVQQVGLMKRIEGPLARAIVKEKNRYITEASTSWALYGRLPAPAFEVHQRNMRGIIEKSAKTSIVTFGRLAAGRMKCGCHFMEKKVDGEFIADVTFNLLAQWWMGKYGAAKVQAISNTTRDDLRRALLFGEQEGDTPAEIRGRLQAVADLSYYRASTIARTETHNTAMFATNGVADKIAAETGAVLTKEWLAVEDERTRTSHAEADGQKVSLDSSFEVGGEGLLYPGDPTGSAENIINCRCVQAIDEA